jgi:phenylalanyl-tRNA synthetase alpha subunit
MTQFIRRTKSINQLSNKEKNMVEKNYQFIMGQIYRDEEFKMLTIPEMEQMEVMFYQHNDPSQEINYEAIF